MICLIDNYDSFTYNLFQMVGSIDKDISVFRNDEVNTDDILKMNPSHIILSPGPGRPENAGICIDIVKNLSGIIPIMGVCLGHQAIVTAMGGIVVQAKAIIHGKQSTIYHDGNKIFKNIPSSFLAARYHSLTVDEGTLPQCMEVRARSEDGTLMAVSHSKHDTHGLQFHPESVLTEYGKELISNFLNKRGEMN